MNILIVEDDPTSLKLLRVQLEAEGHAVLEAHDGVDALALLNRQQVDAVISDILMPRMDGYRLCHEIRKHARLHDLPIIIYTSTYTSLGDKKLALDVGADKYMKKPASVETIITALHEVIAQPHAAPRPEALQEIEGLKEYSGRLVSALMEKNVKLMAAEVKFRALVEQSIVGIYIIQDDQYVYVNPRMAEIFGRSEEEMTLRTVYDFLVPEDHALARENLRKRISGGVSSIHYHLRMLHQSGAVLQVEVHSSRTDYEGRPAVMGTLLDITKRKRAEEEKVELENQLHQAQKMESVGRLAGGVAHDFNNMLGVIIGYAELALMKLEPSQPIYGNLIEIRTAAERSADLTSQLLAFARKQTIAPKVIKLNGTVSGMLNMLQRLIGEDRQLTWKPASNLWPVKVDPSQIDQILANLCVNARDAINDVGRITIETGNSSFDAGYCGTYIYVEPGEYVRLAVSDNGCGMDNETRTHIFEPFFTTKGVGEGTGLGLSTVYGIVKQNHGFIDVYSEPGQGTTFTIYLPRHIGDEEETLKEASTEPIPRGNETILLVEDEPSILKMATILLEGQGYTVLTAGTGCEAIRIFKEQTGRIQLLLTDVVMPDMNGRTLFKDLLPLNPHLECLFMSGYTADVIAHHGVLEEGVHFIQKPFLLSALAAKVREVLDSSLS